MGIERKARNERIEKKCEWDVTNLRNVLTGSQAFKERAHCGVVKKRFEIRRDHNATLHACVQPQSGISWRKMFAQQQRNAGKYSTAACIMRHNCWIKSKSSARDKDTNYYKGWAERGGCIHKPLDNLHAYNITWLIDRPKWRKASVLKHS